ncbi:MAG: glycosyltransferase 87 family protein [Rhodococcus sp. (in: high G+C Gram-positive bacteria)]
MTWTLPSAPPYSGPGAAIPRPVILLAKAAVCVGLVAGILFNFVGLPPLREWGSIYRLDLDVYRIGGRALLDGVNLYGALPRTSVNIPLPFTYPPMAAVSFAPMALLPLTWASAIMTVMTMVLLAVTIAVCLRSLVSMSTSTTVWITGGITSFAFALEPVWSTLDYGQINVVLMCLVVLDTLSKKTPWPRGLLIGFVAAVKLTPAVFVLYFLLRRQYRAALMSGLSFLGFTAIGFMATFDDSVQYWTEVLFDSGRIGGPGYVSNQSLTGMLARLGLEPGPRTVAWVLCSAVVGVLALIAIRRALRAEEYVLALGVNAALGLLISPVSWSHHWVWTVPLLMAFVHIGVARRAPLLPAVAVAGVLLLHYPAHWRLGPGRWSGLGWPLWDQIQASSYVWWGLASIVAVAVVPLTAPRSARSAREQTAV